MIPTDLPARPRIDEPERELWCRVIGQAHDDLAADHKDRRKRETLLRKQKRESAKTFFRSEHFRTLAELIGLDAAAIRRRVRV